MYNNISRFAIIAIVISLVTVAIVTKVGAVPISGMTMQLGNQTGGNTTKTVVLLLL